MNKLKRNYLLILKIIVGLLVFGAILFFVYSYFTAKSALKIESIPESIVYINGEQVGKTPIEIERSESEVDVKLVPEVFGDENVSYSTKVELTKGVKTILRYKFGNGEIDSEMLLVSFRRIGFSEPALAVVSIPDGTQVRVDGDSEGVTPLRLNNLSERTYSVTVDAQGFKSTNFDVTPQNGYILTAFVDLAASNEQITSILDREVQVEEVIDEPAVRLVYINETPTGFLRVRREPLLSSSTIAEVVPGETYELINDEIEGWYEIYYEASESGFISAEYATASGTVSN